MIQPYQIVVDTNVLITGLRSKQGAAYKFLTLLNDRRWQLNLSIQLTTPKAFLQLVGELPS